MQIDGNGFATYMKGCFIARTGGGQPKSAEPVHSTFMPGHPPLGAASMEERNAPAFTLREIYGAFSLDRYIPQKDLRKLAPYRGFVDVAIQGAKPFAMFSNNDDFVAEKYFWNGADAYEAMTLRLWCALARKAPFICDVGAYSGVFALSAAALNRRAKVYAFEALDRVYGRLLINWQANELGNLKPFNLAISDRAGEQELNVYSGEAILVSASSLEEKATGREIYEKKRVTTASLDGLIASGDMGGVSLLKVDAEGAEHLVFEGAAKVLEESKPDIVCELLKGAQTARMQQVFKELGYRFLRIDDEKMKLDPLSELSGAKSMHDLNTLITMKSDAELEALLRSLEESRTDGD